MPIMTPRARTDRPWSTSFFTNTNTTIARKIGAINSGISTKTPPLSLICLRPPCPTPPNHGRRDDQPRLWRWYYPTGKQPAFPTTLPPAPPVLTDPTHRAQRQKPAPPRHRRRTLGSAHRRSLHRQRRRTRSTLANAPHFAPRQQKHSIKWLLKQTQIFPPTLTPADTADHHPHDDDDPKSSIPQTPVESYILATTLVLDAALRDFGHDTDQQHLREQAAAHISQPRTTTDANTDTPTNTDLPPPSFAPKLIPTSPTQH